MPSSPLVGDLVLVTLDHVWAVLEPRAVPMAIMGGLSLAHWKHIRATRDVDLLIQIESANLSEFQQTLLRAGLRPKRQSALLDVGGNRFLQMEYPLPGRFVEVQVDLLLAESDYARQSLDRKEPTKIEGLERTFAVLSCEDLIIQKIVAGRMIDRADAAYLLRYNRTRLDMAYLLRWIGEKQIVPGWQEIWSEAFPTQAVPLPT